MKKGTPYRVWKFKFKTMRYFFKTVSTYVLAALGSIVSLSLSAKMLSIDQPYTEDFYRDMFSLVLSATAFLVALTGIIVKSVAAYHGYCNRPIVQQETNKNELSKSIVKHVSKSHRDSGFEWENYDGQYYLISDEVNKAFFENSGNLFITVNPKKQAKDTQQKETVYNIVTKKIAEGKSIFNSELVRLRTDILTSAFSPFDREKFDGKNNRKNAYTSFSEKLIALEKTDYEANLTTNDLIYSTIYQYDYSDSYQGKNKTVDNWDTLYDLKDSPASNIIGVTTFAITSDGYLLLNLQGKMNDVNSECFVPSGSGSSDFKDLINSVKFEPEGFREEIEKYINFDGRDKFDDAKEFKKFKNEYIDKLSKSVEAETERIAYMNAETAKSEQKSFKEYISKMKKYTYDFNTFLKYGMVRELIEESHLYEKKNNSQTIKYENINDKTRGEYINNTYLCGYIRILDRGGKPDFFGFTLLNLTKDEVAAMFKYGHNEIVLKELKKNCQITDYNEVSRQFYPSIKNIDKYDNDIDFIAGECQFDSEYANKIKISLQTHCLFELLRRNKNAILKLIEERQTSAVNRI